MIKKIKCNEKEFENIKNDMQTYKIFPYFSTINVVYIYFNLFLSDCLTVLLRNRQYEYLIYL